MKQMRFRNVDSYVPFSVAAAAHSRAIDYSISHPSRGWDAGAHEFNLARRNQMKRR
jgi:hypothetical protein